MTGYGAASMQVEAFGDLIDFKTHWQLVYKQCGHLQVLARLGLEDAERAQAYVRRNYARCLTCELMRPASDRRVPLPVANVKCNDGLGEFCRGVMQRGNGRERQ